MSLNRPWGGPNDLQALPTMAGRPRMGTAPNAPQSAPILNAQQFASLIDNTFSVLAAQSQIFSRQQPTRRNLLMLRNTDAAATIYIGFGKAASTLSTLALAPGQIILFDAVVPQDDLWCIGSANCVLAYAFSTFGVEGQ